MTPKLIERTEKQVLAFFEKSWADLLCEKKIARSQFKKLKAQSIYKDKLGEVEKLLEGFINVVLPTTTTDLGRAHQEQWAQGLKKLQDDIVNLIEKARSEILQFKPFNVKKKFFTLLKRIEDFPFLKRFTFISTTVMSICVGLLMVFVQDPNTTFPNDLPSGTSTSGLPLGEAESDSLQVDSLRSKTESDSLQVVMLWTGSWEHIYFDPGKSTLSLEARSSLEKLVRRLKENENDTLSVKIHGFSDNSGEPYVDNKHLAEQRAKAIESYLIQQGIQPERLEAEGIGVDLNQPNETVEDRAGNRHVEIIIHKKRA